ncbi:N-acetylneuraminic acid mutarotase [Haloechinothrix alba]|uniref:N-acetylneuraminic acid mutarotase n=1 Tax=Haloechinothrix alba TaxID=664784 RepID=A0A238VFQ5_9PSEU|nr:kelch repeat-containing protein [Haloechinothrix alba]SNR32994.1 N-acetylneuraminic acid mutarotase [Haloechinothrix alba]
MAVARRTRPAHRVLRAVLITVLALPVLVVGGAVTLIATNPAPEDGSSWERGADLPQQRGEVASAVTGGEPFVLGGLTGPGRTSTAVQAYDPAEDGWRSAPDLPEPRHHAAAAELDGTIYVTGGAASATDWSPRIGVWSLDTGAQRWRSEPPMPEGRMGHALVALDGRLYAFGGDGPATEILVFEPGDGWSRGAPLGDNREHVRAVTLDGEIWAMGGRTGGLLDWVDVYDPVTDTWRAGPTLPEPISAMAVGVVDGSVHVVDGEDPSPLTGGVLQRHFLLPSGADTWEEGPESMLAVHGAGYGVVRDELVIAGGASRQGLLSPLSWSEVTQRYAPG